MFFKNNLSSGCWKILLWGIKNTGFVPQLPLYIVLHCFLLSSSQEVFKPDEPCCALLRQFTEKLSAGAPLNAFNAINRVKHRDSMAISPNLHKYRFAHVALEWTFFSGERRTA